MIISLTDHSAHANLVLLHGIGVLIMGPSGSGKTSLSNQLIQKDLGYQLICDDLVLLSLKKDDHSQNTYLYGADPNLSTFSYPIHLLVYLGDQHNFLDLAQSHPLLSHIPHQINLSPKDPIKNQIQTLLSFIQENLLLQISLFSFGYKHQVDPDPSQNLNPDLIFDLRTWPNPYWDEDLKDLNGTDLKIIGFFNQSENIHYCQNQLDLIQKNIVIFINTALKKNFKFPMEIRIGLGCTGGKHRSVFAVESLAKRLSPKYPSLRFHHRDQNKW